MPDATGADPGACIKCGHSYNDHGEVEKKKPCTTYLCLCRDYAKPN